MTSCDLELSTLAHTWVFDLDGTIAMHNGHLAGSDALLPGVRKFFDNIPDEDTVIILTAREDRFREETCEFLKNSEIYYDHILFGMPTGERILVNDKKESGLTTALAVNLDRNEGMASLSVSIDANL